MLNKPRLLFPRLNKPGELIRKTPVHRLSISSSSWGSAGIAPPNYTPTPTQGVPRHWSAPVQKLGEVLGSGLCAPTRGTRMNTNACFPHLSLTYLAKVGLSPQEKVCKLTAKQRAGHSARESQCLVTLNNAPANDIIW